MRHTAASWLAQDSVPLYDVQALLAHEKLRHDAGVGMRILAPDAHSKVLESWKAEGGTVRESTAAWLEPMHLELGIRTDVTSDEVQAKMRTASMPASEAASDAVSWVASYAPPSARAMRSTGFGSANCCASGSAGRTIRTLLAHEWRTAWRRPVACESDGPLTWENF
jgi:hypothetical protein